MAIGVGLDVYGTLVDPLEMSAHLRPLVGDSAEKLAELWRAKQLEYTFRRASMGKYATFDVCSRQALGFALETLQLGVSAEDRDRLIDAYQSLRAYPDAVPALQRFRDAGYSITAFSNGVEATVRDLLRRAAILPYLDGIVSVDDLRTFKPDPRVYLYLAQRLGCPITSTWLVSSNPFDVVGAKSAGLKAAWLKRKPESVFDPWNIQSDLVASDLRDLVERLDDWLRTHD